MQIEQRVTPFLSFPNEAEEAVDLYVSVIPDSKIVRAVKNPATGAVMIVEFELGGIQFVAMNVGQDWKFTNAFSLSVNCDTQEELDGIWSALAEGGQEIQCGWLNDRFGLAWQIVPSKISQWMSDPDPQKSGRVMGALMQMIKPDIAVLEAAYEGS